MEHTSSRMLKRLHIWRYIARGNYHGKPFPWVHSAHALTMACSRAVASHWRTCLTFCGGMDRSTAFFGRCLSIHKSCEVFGGGGGWRSCEAGLFLPMPVPFPLLPPLPVYVEAAPPGTFLMNCSMDDDGPPSFCPPVFFGFLVTMVDDGGPVPLLTPGLRPLLGPLPSASESLSSTTSSWWWAVKEDVDVVAPPRRLPSWLASSLEIWDVGRLISSFSLPRSRHSAPPSGSELSSSESESSALMRRRWRVAFAGGGFMLVGH